MLSQDVIDSPQTASETLCVLPWIHTHVSTSGKIQLCCVSGSGEAKPITFGSIPSDSIRDVLASPALQRVRDQMVRGQWPAACDSCRRKESLGVRSFRQMQNEAYPKYYEAIRRAPERFEPRVRTVDLRINNLCNFKCRSCSGFSSSAWFSDHNVVYPDSLLHRPLLGFHNDTRFWDEFYADIAPSLEEIHFAGGEPLITEQHYQLLEWLIEAGKTDVELYYDTNLSRLSLGDRDVVRLWQHFPRLRVSLSLDGVGRRGEYLRHGLDYATWVENLRRVQSECGHATLHMHFVVSALNVLDLRSHHDEIVSKGYVNPARLGFTFLEWPPYLSVQVLSPPLKALAVDRVRRMASDDPLVTTPIRHYLERLAEYIHLRDLYPTHAREFSAITWLLDQRRGQNALELFPELAPMLEYG